MVLGYSNETIILASSLFIHFFFFLPKFSVKNLPKYSSVQMKYHYFVDFHTAIIEKVMEGFHPRLLVVINSIFALLFAYSLYLVAFYLPSPFLFFLYIFVFFCFPSLFAKDPVHNYNQKNGGIFSAFPYFASFYYFHLLFCLWLGLDIYAKSRVVRK